MHRRLKNILLYFTAATLAFCLSTTVRAASINTNTPIVHPINVLVSIAPQKFFIEKIGGSHVQVTVLVPEGADPHNYSPAPSVMRSAATAELYFTTGLDMENAWFQRIVPLTPQMKVARLEQIVQAVQPFPSTNTHEHPSGDIDTHATHMSEAAEHAKPNGHSEQTERSFQRPLKHMEKEQHYKNHSSNGYDTEPPVQTRHDTRHFHSLEQHSHGAHIWLSPHAVFEMLPGIRSALIEARPELADVFTQNEAAFKTELIGLDTKIHDLFIGIPDNERVFLSFHPAWGNFAADYGLTEITIEMDGKEPGARRMAQIIAAAKQHKINTVFIEPQFSQNAASAVAAALSATIIKADPLAENWLNNIYSVAVSLAASMHKKNTGSGSTEGN